MPFLRPLIYLDVGAREMKRSRFVEAFPESKYIGFELDVEECKRLNALGFKRHKFYAEALGRRCETRTIYVTRNPACSSLYEPNSQEMQRFMKCGPYFDLLEKRSVDTISLDDWFRDRKLSGVEFLELDTQGSELDILQGSEALLKASILGLQIEVEFFPLYKNQPLFADIDNYLRPLDFLLFDLSRYRLRRAYLKTRGQLLWGHAFYLKNVYKMNDRQPEHFLALAAIASFYGFEDYALEVLRYLIEKDSDFELYDHNEKIHNIVGVHADPISQPIRKGIQRMRKKASSWRVSSRTDGGYFIKD